MALDTLTNRKQLIFQFPLLANDSCFSITSERSAIYNCIAFAMGMTNCWVDFFKAPGHWWPSGVSEDGSPESLIQAFQAVGFTVTENKSFEKDVDKVILYSANGLWTHATRIEPNEQERGKFGALWDAVHGHNMFQGSVYGEPYAYMKRTHSSRPAPITNGNITVLKRPVWR